MVFKKKETAEQKKARLEAELATMAAEVEKELEPPQAPTRVQEVVSEPTGNDVAVKSLIEEIEQKYGSVFPELGPSGHVAVERLLLLAIVGELRELREALKP